MKIYDSEPTRPKFQPISGSWKFSDTTCYMTPELNVENFMIIKGRGIHLFYFCA